MESQGKKIAIVDYGIGNLFSVLKACEFVGLNAKVESNIDSIMTADAIILPGVGAFRNAMENMRSLNLDKAIIDFSKTGKPVMGVCLGMQLLMSESEEFGLTKGLNIIEGICKKFPNEINSVEIRVPQIGWNSIYSANNQKKFDNLLLDNISNGELMYFVHSYYVIPENKENIFTITDYQGLRYCSGIRKDNIFAFQFHPEKSAHKGLLIYQNFKTIVDNWKI
ncbi:MAG: imidazole glycerol phosphate synthase subunit HisH [Cytophagaceae bacterium]|nr:imidazole glycerol phosphate synthase subunit HisH [Cytophagaceae bacterium]